MNLDRLIADYQFGVFRNTRWSYDTTDDLATMNSAGYFSAANQGRNRRLQIGDEILATTWDTAVPTGGKPVTGSTIAARTLFVVHQVNDDTGVVDVTNGDSRTLTDSD